MKVLLENKQHQYVMQFLMGLNDSFSHVRALILMTDPIPSISKAFALVVQEERQRNINIPSLALAIDFVALEKFMEHPKEPHYKAAQHILQYIKGAPSQGMLYPSNSKLHIKAFSDSDWRQLPHLVKIHGDGIDYEEQDWLCQWSYSAASR
jgi:hypothetical protein